MTLEVHTVDLKARDGISPVLRQVGQAANDMGRNVGESVRRFNFDRAAMAGGLRELQGALSDWSRAAAEEEAGMQRLAQAVENAGDSYAELSPQIDQLIARGERLSFADDKVVDSLSRLTTVTGDTGEAMNQMGLVMDFARERGISLTSSADIIGKVYEGNIGILARYGIALEEGTTATEALAILQQRVSGQAQIYSDSDAGKIERYANMIDNATESLASHTGALQTFLALMPGMNAAYSTLAALLAGIGGAGTLASVGLPLAAIAGVGALAYGYNDQAFGTSAINQGANQFFLYGAQGMNALLPGNPYDTQKYIDQMRINSTLEAIDQMLIAPGEDSEIAWDRIAAMTGTITGEMSRSELATYVEDAALRAGMTVGQYLISQAGSAGYVRDPASGTYMSAQDYALYSNTRYFNQGGNLTSGATTMAFGTLADGAFVDRTARYPFLSSYRAAGSGAATLPEGASEYMRGGMGAVAMTGIGAMDATTQNWFDTTKLENYRAALRATYGEYAGLVEGINSANDATRAFQATQDGILASQAPYNQQLSEYNGVLSDMEAGYKVLQERQAEGIALSREEQEFLKNYDALYARVSGGVEDATVANALLAAQYAENMSKGDQLNEMLAGNSEQTGNLVDAIELLILSMEGVPEEVRSRILLDNAAETQQSLSSIVSLLNSLDGRSATFYVNAAGNGVSIGNPNGPSITPLATGGMFSTAATGRMINSRYALVGENGPELVALPGGSLVTPYGATRAAGRGGGNTYNITVYANDPMDFANQMRSRGLAEAWA